MQQRPMAVDCRLLVAQVLQTSSNTCCDAFMCGVPYSASLVYSFIHPLHFKVLGLTMTIGPVVWRANKEDKVWAGFQKMYANLLLMAERAGQSNTK